MKIAVLMSGGVDSSVAALKLKKKGENLIGVIMKNYSNLKFGFDSDEALEKSIIDAERVCNQIGIDFFVIDLQKKFENTVIKKFIEDYSCGLTPNPCSFCNPVIKWGYLLEECLKLGAEKIATGHYVQIDYDSGGKEYYLKKSLDKKKDQSYMLWGLTQYQLSRTIFPNSSITKTYLRQIAQQEGLHNHGKKDSQEICFIKDHYGDFLKKIKNLKKGEIVFTDKTVIGEHNGLELYTIGQRKGLNCPWTSALYVLKKDHKNNRLIVTDNIENLKKDVFYIKNVNFINKKPIYSLNNLKTQIRYNSNPVDIRALEKIKPDLYRVLLSKPTYSISPGQSAVFYSDDYVYGGGEIVDVLEEKK